MRGDPQDLDLDLSLASRLLDQVNRVGTLTITGGEPSLVPHIISGIFDLAAERNIEIGQFYIATNAKKVTREFIDVLFQAYLYCDSIEDDETICLEISSDIQHQESADGMDTPIPEENIKKLLAFQFAGKRNEGRNYQTDMSTLWEGRAQQFYSRYRDASISKVYYEITKGEKLEIDVNDTIYLNCLGDIVPDGDLSYKTQSDSDIIICNVKRKGFSLWNSILRFNKRCEDGDIYNIRVA
jgi:hypothetical protein